MKVGDNTDLRQACKCSMKKIGDNSDLRQSHLLYHALLPVVGVITDHYHHLHYFPLGRCYHRPIPLYTTGNKP
jgi:hypothetical protein